MPYKSTVSAAFLDEVEREAFGALLKFREQLRNKKSNREKRAKLLKEDPYCYYCGCRLTLDDSTLDHALPRSKGGTDEWSNLVLACYECNQDKGDKIIVVWGRQ